MTNPDWTDRTLPVPERIAAWKAYRVGSVERDAAWYEHTCRLLEDCAVLIQGLGTEIADIAAEHGKAYTKEQAIASAIKWATGPDGKRWFPEPRTVDSLEQRHRKAMGARPVRSDD